MAKKRNIGKILLKKGKISQEELDEALEYAEENSCRLGEALVKLSFTKAETIAKAVAKQNSLPYVNLSNIELPKSLLKCIPVEAIQEHMILPVRKKGRILIIASADPLDFITLDNFRFQFGMDSVECAIASYESILKLVSANFGLAEKIDDLLDDFEDGGALDFRDDNENIEDGDSDNDAGIIRLVNLIIKDAISKRTSDIHIEPMEKELRVRYRIDGVCIPQTPPPKKLQGSIIARIKIMADMDMTERRRPQDGRIKLKLDGRDVDFRVSSLPAYHGESVVLRILDKEKALVDLEDLGMHPTEYAIFQKMIKRPNGIFLVTGPTGSGKTTTLYAALKKLNKPDLKIITAENPVEYNLTGINQAEVKHTINMTFAKILKAMLRQAPNVILVGEIRDLETAETAVQAALTGHLVFSTLHTNNAPSAISRLLDMDVKPFLVASAVIAVLAQRLIRSLCPKCKVLYDPPEEELRAVGLSADDIIGSQIYRAVGCEACEDKGYRGRRGVYELMAIDPVMRDMIFDGANTTEIENHAVKQGMATIQKDTLRKVMAGLTTIDEVLRLTHRTDLSLSY